MRAFKIFRQRSDGTLGPLFINARLRVPLGQWLQAEDHPTRGFAHRPGWHCTTEQNAPHIKLTPKHGTKRVWCRVEIGGSITKYARPESQGGTWLLAERLRVLEILR